MSFTAKMLHNNTTFIGSPAPQLAPPQEHARLLPAAGFQTAQRMPNRWMVALPALIGGLLASTAPAAVVDRQIAADSEKVIVAQDGVAVTLGDLDAWMQGVPEEQRAGFIRSPKRIETTLYQLLMVKQLNREARAQGLDKDPFVQRQVQQAVERVIAGYQREKVATTIAVPDLDQLARERYLVDPEQFRVPDSADVVHLLIVGQDRGNDAAKALIEKLYRQARKHPENLEKLALEHSDDPSAKTNSGVMQAAGLDTLDPSFAAAVRKLRPGELSAPVQSQFGWHIIRLDAFHRGEVPSFEAIEDRLVNQLRQEWRTKTFNAYFDELRQRALEPDPEVIAELPFRYGDIPDLTGAGQPASVEDKTAAEVNSAVPQPAADPGSPGQQP